MLFGYSPLHDIHVTCILVSQLTQRKRESGYKPLLSPVFQIIFTEICSELDFYIAFEFCILIIHPELEGGR